MIYEFKEGIINYKDVNNFYDINNFVGYILPDGSIYKCKNHNITNVNTILFMYLMLLKDNYNDKDLLLNIDTSDKLLKIIISYFKNASYNEIVALSNFINANNLLVSDLIVSLFRCHLITRLDKTIITSESNHICFYNYLLNDFKIHTIDRLFIILLKTRMFI